MKYPNTLEEGKKWNYKFWEKEPMGKINEVCGKLSQIKFDLIEPIVDEFQWITENVNEVKISKFLTRNYSKKTKKIFTDKFIKWLHSFGNYICMLRDDIIFGYCFYTKSSIQIEDVINKSIDVKFFCLDETIRNNGLIEKMIIHLKWINKEYNIGTFESQMYIPHPLTTTTSYLKFLKLNDVAKKVLEKNDKLKVNEVKKVDIPKDRICVKVDKTNLDIVYKIYLEYMDKFLVHDIIEKEMFEKIILNDFVKAYCIKKGDEIIDFFCFYKYKMYFGSEKMKIGKMLFYSCVNDTIYYVIKCAIGMMSECDIVEINSLMDSEIALVDFGFNGKLMNYNLYIYGWKCGEYQNNSVCRWIL
jgi:hypothetical protein